MSHHRGGCTCGSPVMSANSGYPDVRYIHAATLDDQGTFVPQRVVWRSERQPWDHLDPDLGWPGLAAPIRALVP